MRYRVGYLASHCLWSAVLMMWMGGCSGSSGAADSDAALVPETGGGSGGDAGLDLPRPDARADGSDDDLARDLTSESADRGDAREDGVVDSDGSEPEGGGDAAPDMIGCVQQWPATKASMSASALTVTPTVLSTTSIPSGPIQRSMAVTRSRVAITSASGLLILDRQGTLLHTVSHGLVLSSPAADSQENLYFSDSSYSYSVDKDGVERWRHPFGPARFAGEFIILGQPLLSPLGIVYVVGVDGYLWGLDATSGNELLKVDVGVTTEPGPLQLQFGAGDSLFLRGTFGDPKIAIEYDTIVVGTDGTPRGGLIDPSGWRATTAIAGAGVGIVGSGYRAPGSDLSTTEVFDTCGRSIWTVPGDYSQPVFIGPRDELVILDMKPQSPGYDFSLRKFSKTGDLLAGPTVVPPVQVVTMGADETIYLVACEGIFTPSLTPPSAMVIALSSNFQELWRVPLGEGTCPSGAVLSDDGTLYIGREITSRSNQLVAVRTTSPGVSPATWPQFSYGSYWLAP